MRQQRRGNSPIFAISFLRLVAALIIFMGLGGMPLKQAWAFCGDYPSCISPIHESFTRKTIEDEHDKTREHITEEFQNHRDAFWPTHFHEVHLRPDLQKIATQLTATAIAQTRMIGAFFDAEQNSDAIRALQARQAQAHKTYRPSKQICTFASLSEPLQGTSAKLADTTNLLIDRSLDRQSRAVNTAAGLEVSSAESDFISRRELFISRFCDPGDNDGQLGVMCNAGGPEEWQNRDIDFTRTILHPDTLGVDFYDNTLQEEEAAVFALGNNLYAHDLYNGSFNQSFLSSAKGRSTLETLRSIWARRSVGELSFAHLVASKSPHQGIQTELLKPIFINLGVDPAELDLFTTETPSYYALMDVLTKKLYQDPQFYTSLYTSPANVERTSAALSAFEVMQKMDHFDSALRQEMMLAVITGVELDDIQSEITNRINEITND